MTENPSSNYDFLIAGSGFAGTITAMALKQMGYTVCVVERSSHPRFAIGESSTPIADMILRDFGSRFNLPFLKKLSRYGSWQKYYPDLICGIKRGFSYYPHQAGTYPEGNAWHTNELIVAASENDQHSDTNWLRSDVDHFLVREAVKLGVPVYEASCIKDIKRKNDQWIVWVGLDGESKKITSSWIIDATGSPGFSQQFFGTRSGPDGFETRSVAVYSHFENTGRWYNYLEKANFHTKDYPYNPDHSALHHLLDEGWLWMLRFHNNLLSAGLVLDLDTPGMVGGAAEKKWQAIISKYPSLKDMFTHAAIAEIPGKILQTGRLQRSLNHTFGDGWLALNHTAGFVDPLHSTGIAFALCGIEKIVNLFDPKTRSNDFLADLNNIQLQTFRELHFIDMLVSACYKSRNHFELFTAAVMLYFAATVTYEQNRLNGEIPETFLCAGDDHLMEVVSLSYHEIKEWQGKQDGDKALQIIEKIRIRIEPYNCAGLMDPGVKNMYRHTAVEMP